MNPLSHCSLFGEANSRDCKKGNIIEYCDDCNQLLNWFFASAIESFIVNRKKKGILLHPIIIAESLNFTTMRIARGWRLTVGAEVAKATEIYSLSVAEVR